MPTPVPSDFQAPNAALYGAVPHRCYWRSLHGTLRKLVGGDEADPAVPAWRFVGQELCRFLEIYDMSSSDLTSIDVAALNVSMPAARHLYGCFDEIGSELLHRYPEQLLARKQNYEYLCQRWVIWLRYARRC